MTQQSINIGQADKGNGDPLRTAFSKVNENFTELYSAIGADVQIPSQTNNSGKYLTTNGTTLSWATVAGGGLSTWKFGTDGRLTFPNGVVPEHSYGAAGDKEGMVVFTDPYIYYCKQDYIDDLTDIWVRVAWTGTNW